MKTLLNYIRSPAKLVCETHVRLDYDRLKRVIDRMLQALGFRIEEQQNQA